jgi:hypothetical protein
MKIRILANLAWAAIGGFWASSHSQVMQQFSGALAVSVSPAGAFTAEQHEILEVTLTHVDPGYANPFWDIGISAKITSPGGIQYGTGGFYYDVNTWKIRFAPPHDGVY